MSVRSAGTSTFLPSTRTSPRLGGSAVASSRSRVVLPAPFGPSNPTTPGSRSRSTSARATGAPNERPTPRRLIEPFMALPPGSKLAQVALPHQEEAERRRPKRQEGHLDPGLQHHG